MRHILSTSRGGSVPPRAGRTPYRAILAAGAAYRVSAGLHRPLRVDVTHWQKSALLRTPARPPARPQMCRKFDLYGACPYGNRCRFIHKGLGGTVTESPRVSVSGSSDLPPFLPSIEDGPRVRSSTPTSRGGSSSLEDAETEALRRLPVFRQLSIDERRYYGSRSCSLNSLRSSRHNMRHSSDESYRRMSIASSAGISSNSVSTTSLASASGMFPSPQPATDEWHAVSGFPSPFVAADAPGSQQQHIQQLQQPVPQTPAQLQAAAFHARRSLGSALPPPVPAYHASPLATPLRPRSTSAAHLHLAAQQQLQMVAQQNLQREALQIQQLQQELQWRQQRQWQLQQLLLQTPSAEQDPALMAELAVLRSLA